MKIFLPLSRRSSCSGLTRWEVVLLIVVILLAIDLSSRLGYRINRLFALRQPAPAPAVTPEEPESAALPVTNVSPALASNAPATPVVMAPPALPVAALPPRPETMPEDEEETVKRPAPALPKKNSLEKAPPGRIKPGYDLPTRVTSVPIFLPPNATTIVLPDEPGETPP